ncbi:MAG: hypothetical protein CO189_04940 [candidate division Zixibacteria bacterium CG_4_9_14_3_um_filter_46_8]|nr:MAG: hypothetical protein CO189_04940 [candidate division Zixibacteria bacterium CG_4_9_14_3_um_filter_46_8]
MIFRKIASVIAIIFLSIGNLSAEPALMPGWPWHTISPNYDFYFALGPFDGLTFIHNGDTDELLIPFGLGDSTMYLLDSAAELMPGWPVSDNSGWAGGEVPPVFDADGDGLEEAFVYTHHREGQNPFRNIHALNYLGEEPVGFPIQVFTGG